MATALVRSTNPDFGLQGWYVAAGWVLLGCAALGVWHAGRRHWPLLAVAVVMWLLSLGPKLTVAGHRTGLLLPYALIQNLPLLRTARRPSHFAVVSIILATVFAGLGLFHLVRGRPRSQRWAIVAGVTLLATIELAHPPWTPVAFKQHPVAKQLRSAPGPVADLPYEWMESGRSLRNQILHEQPILGGYVARRPSYPTAENPLIHQLAWMRSWPQPDVIATDPVSLQNMQCYYRLRHVLLDTALMTADEVQVVDQVLQAMSGQPVVLRFDDGTTRWYELPVPRTPCRPFLYLGQGWYERETDGAAVWRWASGDNDLWVVNPFDEAIQATIQIAALVPAGARTVALWQGTELIGRWEVGNDLRAYRLPIRLPPGATNLRLEADTVIDPVSQRPVSVLVTQVGVESWQTPER